MVDRGYDSGAADVAITLTGVVLTAFIGALPGERAVPQRLRLDCELRYDASSVVGSDRLEDAVDYAAVTETLRDVMRARPRHLLETAAAECADAVLSAYRPVHTVSVAVSKPGMPPGVDRTTVRVTRRR